MNTSTKKDRDLDRAMAAAREYRETAEKYGSNHAKCVELADQIFGYVGHWDTSGVMQGREAKRILPQAVREAMGFHNIQDWRMP